MQAGAAIELAGGDAADDVLDVPAVDAVGALAEQALQFVQRVVVGVAGRLADGQQGDLQAGCHAEFGELLGNRLDAALGVVIGDMENDVPRLAGDAVLRVHVGNQDGAVRYQVVLDAESVELGGGFHVAHRDIAAIPEVARDRRVDQRILPADLVAANAVVHHLQTGEVALARNQRQVRGNGGQGAAETDEQLLSEQVRAGLDRVVERLGSQVADDALPLGGQALAAGDDQQRLGL